MRTINVPYIFYGLEVINVVQFRLENFEQDRLPLDLFLPKNFESLRWDEPIPSLFGFRHLTRLK